jgi:hypothetical protein
MYVVNIICQAIEKVNVGKFHAMVINNVATCKSASRIIKDKYPHVTYSGCTTHGSDLVFKDIGKIEWVSKLAKEVKANITFITNNHKS